MPRFHATSAGPVQFTPEEETARDAEEAAVAAAEPAQAAEAARKAGIDAAIGGDTTIASLKAMTSAEYDTWWAANVTNAAQAIGVLKRVCRVVIRRVL